MKNYQTDSQFTGFVSEKLAKDLLKTLKDHQKEQKKMNSDYKTSNLFLLFFRKKLIIALADAMIDQEELQEELFKANKK